MTIERKYQINGGIYRATAAYVGNIYNNTDDDDPNNDYKTVIPGTCALVGPRVALTCCHNVYDFQNKKFIGSAWINPGVNGNMVDDKFGLVNVVEVKYSLEYVADGYAQDDWAVLILDKDITSKFGYFGIGLTDSSNNFYGQEVTVNGYPLDKNDDIPLYQYTATGKIIGFIDGYYLHDADTEVGNSGSPMIVLCDGEYKVVGVHSHGKGKRNGGITSPFNGGPAIDQNLLQVILNARNDYT